MRPLKTSDEADPPERSFVRIPAETWNARVTQARTANTLSKKKLALLVGVAPPTVSDWESGEIKAVDGGHLLALELALSVSARWIMTGKPTPQDLGDLPLSGLPARQRRMHDAFEWLTPSQQEETITRLETIKRQNERQLAELQQISDRRGHGLIQPDLFPTPRTLKGK